ncbi:MAG: hypothetical protein O3C45_04685 [Bacteroidetes bacterium]|nr:hypothetical protein [Bacteroidota bacterium]
MKRMLLIGWLLVGTGLLVPAHGQIARLARPDSLGLSFFGTSVAIDGHWAVVGATGDDHCGQNAGSAWVYRRSGATWHLAQRLEAADCEEGAFFGHDVAIDEDRIVVSAFRTFVGRAVSNHVYVFEYENETWEQTDRISSPDRDTSGPFAASLALDGDHLLVTSAGDASGSDTKGKGFLFRRERSGWALASELESPLPLGSGTLGASAAMDGRHIAIAASTYARDQPGFVATWVRQDDGRWNRGTTLRGIQGFFIDVALHKDRLLIGESRGGSGASGSARLLQWNGEAWVPEAVLTPRTPYQAGAFGSRVALGPDVALVAGFDEQLELDFNVDQVVYVFARKEQDWVQRRVLDVGESAFGASLALDGYTALIGQAADGIPGQAYVATLRAP